MIAVNGAAIETDPPAAVGLDHNQLGSNTMTLIKTRCRNTTGSDDFFEEKINPAYKTMKVCLENWLNSTTIVKDSSENPTYYFDVDFWRKQVTPVRLLIQE